MQSPRSSTPFPTNRHYYRQLQLLFSDSLAVFTLPIMIRQKASRCPFCSAGPFVKRAALAGHISQRSSCSTAALARARQHITQPYSNNKTTTAPQRPSPLAPNQSPEPQLEPNRSPSPRSDDRPTKRLRTNDSSIPQPNTFSLLFPEEKHAGRVSGYDGTPFERQFKSQQQKREDPWSPFADEEEWGLADWFMTAEVSQEDIDKFLKLKIVSFGYSFRFAHPRF